MRSSRDVPGWGDRVRRLREARNWSQGELAERAGTTQAQVSRIEGGQHTNARKDTLWGLADALGVSLDYLLGREQRDAAAEEDDEEESRIARIVRVVLVEQERERYLKNHQWAGGVAGVA